MINSIIESISTALNAEFGDRYRIHREEERQDLIKPCFFIQCISPSERQFFWKRYFRQNQFCIQYFPEDSLHGSRECCETAERLFSCLEYLDTGSGLLRGTGMRHETAEGILSFFVDYDMFVYKAAEAAQAMGEVSEEISLKGQVV